MCEPATLAIIGTAVATAGAGVTAYMGYQQQQFRSKVAAQNAKLEGERAASELAKGQEERRQLQRKYAGLAGSQRASMAANGIDVEFGSAADLLGDTERTYREDLSTSIGNNAAAVKGIDISSANYGAESAAAKQAATGELVAGGFNMASTVLGGVGKVNKIKAAQKAGGSGWGV